MWTLTPTPTPTLTLTPTPTPGVVHKLFWTSSRRAKNQLSKTSIKYDHLQLMETMSGKFHQNTLKTVGGVAETRNPVDKMAKTDKGP